MTNLEKRLPKPECSINNQLKALNRDTSGEYCCRYFPVGKGCEYLRIKDKRQECIYYKRIKEENYK